MPANTPEVNSFGRRGKASLGAGADAYSEPTPRVTRGSLPPLARAGAWSGYPGLPQRLGAGGEPSHL
jgi:hypothetical protein